MSNLRLYQWLTTTAKKVGGPAKLIGMFISSGAIVGGVAGSLITNKYRDIKENSKLKPLGTYSVVKDAEIKKIKLVLKSGDKITVLAECNDSILIVKNGDKNNPYFVSDNFLIECTDYKKKH